MPHQPSTTEWIIQDRQLHHNGDMSFTGHLQSSGMPISIHIPAYTNQRCTIFAKHDHPNTNTLHYPYKYTSNLSNIANMVIPLTDTEHQIMQDISNHPDMSHVNHLFHQLFTQWYPATVQTRKNIVKTILFAGRHFNIHTAKLGLNKPNITYIHQHKSHILWPNFTDILAWIGLPRIQHNTIYYQQQPIARWTSEYISQNNMGNSIMHAIAHIDNAHRLPSMHEYLAALRQAQSMHIPHLPTYIPSPT